MDQDGVVERTSGEDRGVGAEVDGGALEGSAKCSSELARVEALLLEEEEMVVAGAKRREEVSKVLGSEFASCAGGARRESLERGVGLEGDADAGEDVELIEKVGIEREAEVGKGTELRWVMRVVGGQHSSGGR
jgi:hypothetical protein